MPESIFSSPRTSLAGLSVVGLVPLVWAGHGAASPGPFGIVHILGDALHCKLILFAAMIGFRAWNLFLLKPRIAIDIPTVNIPEQKSAVRLLLRNVLWEIGLGTFVILIVGLLGITPPPMR